MSAENINFDAVNRQRRTGVLLHPTSLPGPFYYGDIGHQAYRFIEFLNANGIKVWQMLPLGPTHDDKSPYQCLSAHAGSPLLISLDWLKDQNWLTLVDIESGNDQEQFRRESLLKAGEQFYNHASEKWQSLLNEFCIKQACWLDDYALFMTFKKKYNNAPWYEWPESIRHRDKYELENASTDLEADIKQIKFEQFVFFTQWHEVREYAKKHDVEIFGDMPIFVARDSADVWAQRENFLMDSDGNMPFVAGVPPDAFTDSGQRWGNPLYNWEYMQDTEFDWWKERFKTQLELFDILRIDHFRGLQACWQIPEEDETAVNGSWVDVPGKEMLTEIFKSFPYLPLVAEDLGVITEDVVRLKESFNLPGMKVLQFAFDGSSDNPHLPHLHNPEDVVYSGTHDNDTTLGWANNEENFHREFFDNYCGGKYVDAEQRAWQLIRMSLSSVSFLCVLPFQDILMLDSSARMNVPGTTVDNWAWRFDWQQVEPESIEKLNKFMWLYQR